VAELPSGTVTFLFTDLEGSTRLWEEHPQAMRAALARHDAILREAIESHSGQIVKTTGDGAHAAFAIASDAVEAAIAAQLALGSEAWGDATGPLRVRMGVHTGAAEIRDGDYYGTTLNRAARIMSVGHGGQIVVSLATSELVDNSNIGLVDLGEHQLRDLAQPARVFQVCHPDLVADFPPLRSLVVLAGNLPPQVTSFVGRTDELVSVSTALGQSQLVTLTGMGGVGKTRLALQVAAGVLPRHTDGAWFCELAAAGDPEAMMQVLASNLGVMPRAGMSLGESVVDYLRSKRLLLVLDNCEHLLEAAAEFATAVLRNCAHVTVLATSREALAVPGEQVWPVRPLSIAGDAAVRLFVERARSARPDFAFDETNGEAVVDICRRLDGIPLAIELAAARVASMVPADIVARLDERFRLLTGSRRGAVERHQTLRSAVDWSYSLLDDVTRPVFVRLGVFAGSFDARAAEEIASGDGLVAWDVVDGLRELVAKSLVSVDDSVPSSTRYQMLETLRAYARERLDDEGQIDRWRRRHATYYASFAEEAGPMMLGPDWLAWLPRLRAELDDLRASVSWALESDTDDDGELAVRIAAALANLASDDRSNGIHVWAERSAARAERSTPGRRMAILGAAAMTAWSYGDLNETRRLADAALRHGLAEDCPAPMWPYATLALTQVLSGEPESALATLTQADEAFRRVGVHDWHLARLFQVRSYVEAMLGMPTAPERAQESLRIGRELQSVTLLNGGLFNVAYTSWRENPEDAMDALEESIALSRAGAVFVAYGDALGLLAQLQAQAQDPRALDTMRAAIVEGSDIGSRTTLATSLDRAVIAFHSLGRDQLAAQLAGSVTAGALEPLTVLPFPEHAAREETIRRVRDELGPEQYDQAAARGAAMSYDELVAHIVTELDREIETRDG
jgi:predicted ATPase/class 3 adenylate cyclase